MPSHDAHSFSQGALLEQSPTARAPARRVGNLDIMSCAKEAASLHPAGPARGATGAGQSILRGTCGVRQPLRVRVGNANRLLI